jgi:hypothetical protein
MMKMENDQDTVLELKIRSVHKGGPMSATPFSIKFGFLREGVF